MNKMQAIDKVLERLVEYSRRGGEFRAKCPNHRGESDDSLSIREDDDGKVLLHCHSGCDKEQIVDALGLEMSELFSRNGRTKGKPVGPPPEKDQVIKTFTVEDLPGALDEYMVFEKEDGTPFYIQKHKGPVYRVVGFDDDGDPLLVSGLGDVEPILFGLPKLREAIEAGKPVVHTEGCKDALSAQRPLGVAGVTSGSCTSWKSVFAHGYEGATEVWIVPDNDDEGRDYAHEVAQDLAGVVRTLKIINLPDLGPKGDLTDWLDDGHTAEEFFAICEAAPALGDIKPWPKKPAKLDVGLPQVEPFDSDLLPEPLEGWVLNVAEMMDNAPPDYVAISAAVEGGAILGRRMGIRPKEKADWTVYPNLWGALVGPPTSLKSPAMLSTLKPINMLGSRADEKYAEAMKQHKYDLMVVEAEKQALEKALKDLAKGVATGDIPRSEIDAIKEKFEQLEEPEEPIHQRFHTNDTTVEELGENLVNNPNGILLYRDELMGWLKTLDRPERGSDRAFFIEGWSGDVEHLLDRVTRGYKRIPVCLSILGGIQPGPLIRYVGEAMEDEGEKADGLLQRFQLLVWPDHHDRKRTDIPPDRGARNRAYEVYEKLAELDPAEFGAVRDDKNDPPYVHFSPEAQQVYNEWYDTYENAYGGADTPPALQAHIGKYRSLLPSLALVFEAMDFVTGKSKGRSVGEENTLRAAGWCSYLESHALRVYSPLMFSPERRARVLLEKIQKGEIRNGAKIRDIRRRSFPGLETVEHLRVAADILEDLGWVRRVEVKSPGRGRPTEKLSLHPEERE
jgi:hypothetical protein